MAFDPNDYIANFKEAEAVEPARESSFDPDAYLADAPEPEAEEPVSSSFDPDAYLSGMDVAEATISEQPQTPSVANQEFKAKQGLDNEDPTKMSNIFPPSKDTQTTVAEVTSQPVSAGGIPLEERRSASRIAKDLGGSVLSGGAAVPANIGTSLETTGQALCKAKELIDAHPILSIAVPPLAGTATLIKVAGKPIGKALEFVGKASSEWWSRAQKTTRKQTISESGRKSTHPAWVISSGIAETTPQLIADFITGRVGGKLTKGATSLVTSAVEGNTAGASQKRQVADSIKAMSNEDLQSLPVFAEAMEKAGGDIDKAREISANVASNRAYATTFLTTTLTSLALDKVGGGTLDKWMQDPKIAKIGLKRIFSMAGMEGTEEAFQSGFETMISNRETGKPLMDGVMRAMGYGAVTGAILAGGLTGATSALQTAQEGIDGTTPTAEQTGAEPPVTPLESPTRTTPPTALESLEQQLTAKVEENTATSASGEIGVNKNTPQSGTEFGKASEENEKALQKIIEDGKRSVPQLLKQHLADADSGVKDTLLRAGAKDAVTQKVLSAGASANAALEFKQGRNTITTALKEGYGRFEGGTSEKLMADFIDATRTVEATQIQEGRDKVLKSRQGITAETAQARLDEIEATTNPRDLANVKNASEAYFATLRSQLDQSLESELISPEAHAFMTEHHKHYSPRLFVDALDSATVGGKRGDLDSGLKALDEGSEKAMITDPSILMEHTISRTQSRIFKNRANKELASFIQENPEQEFGRIIKDEGQAKRGEEIITAFEGGQKQLIAMPRDMATQWNGTPPAIRSDVAQIMQWGSGTKILKALATGFNPEFVLSNLPRDIAFATFNSGQYSNFIPKALTQIAADYAGVTKDAIRRDGQYKDYVKEGGGMDFLSTQGRLVGKSDGARNSVRTKLKGVASTAFDVLSYLGETSEIMTRLAVRNRGIKNGLTPADATFASRNMLDFSQGGTTTKAMDNLIPYLNAATQGTRGTLRTLTTDPKGSAIKIAQLIAMGIATAYGSRAKDEEAWDSISDREKATKWVIPLGVKKKDKNGNDRHAYLAIAKDQGQQIFSAIGQSLVDGKAGKPWSKQMINSVLSLLPVEAAGILPPIANASVAYLMNYDTWTQEKVWRGYQDLDASNERRLTTPVMAKGLSDIAKSMGVEISPEKLSTATSKVIPASNPVVAGISDIASSLTQKDNDTIVEKLKKIPFSKRILRFSRQSNATDRQSQEAERFGIDKAGKVSSELRTEISGAKKEQNNFRQVNNLKADDVMASEATTAQDLRQWLNTNIVSIDERKRLWMRERGKHPDIISGAFNFKTS